MAKVPKFFLFGYLLAIYSVNICLALERIHPDHARVHTFTMDNAADEVESHPVNKRSTRHRREAGDATCQMQENLFLADVRTDDIIDSHVFTNETKFSLALSWAGENDGVILVTATQEELFAVQSDLYRSDNGGKSFVNINEKIDNSIIKKMNGLQKHLVEPQTVFVVCHSVDTNGLMYRTTDGGVSFTKLVFAFTFDGPLVFNPTQPNWILVRSLAKDLYLTTDNGATWKQVQNNVQNFKWSTMVGDSKTIFAVHDKTSIFEFFDINNELVKSSDLGETWLTKRDKVYSFGMQGKFLYASILSDGVDERVMEVSTDGGSTWSEAQLPSITEDRFYSILDMSEGMIFMHVDNPGDTGHGILYTSDQTGVIFAESLTNHLYPNYVELTDFYKVSSMRGTYLASQMSDADQSIHTVISFDRGGEWNHVTRPKDVPCKDETKDCYLQIHNKYSQSRGVKANTPLSVSGAPGIIMVHGHVADALQTTSPDVYVTSDGGYSWSLALNGPHHYQIADQGGLLVAVPSDTPTPNIIKFSTDEGRCWHEYQFTNESVVMTGLLTEPGNKAMSVAIFGYGETDKQWRTFVVDFKRAIPNQCVDINYEDWLPHEGNSKDTETAGCLLGRKETFKRLKKDSWCRNGHSFEATSTSTSFCQCTHLDYECDYGYSRDLGSDTCKKDRDFVGPDIDICLRGHEEELVTTGYRKIPGDQCQGGFSPQGDELIDLKEHCAEGSKAVVEEDLGITDFHKQMDLARENKTRSSFMVTLGVLAVLLICSIVLAVLVKKYRMLKKVPNIRYGALRTENDLEQLIDENLGNTPPSLYEDDSDDDIESAAKGGGGVFLFGNRQAPAPTPLTSATSPPPSYRGMATSPPRPGTAAPAAPRSPRSPGKKGGGAPIPKVTSYHDDSDEDMLL